MFWLPAGTQDYHAYVRQKAIEYMHSHRGDFEVFLGERPSLSTLQEAAQLAQEGRRRDMAAS